MLPGQARHVFYTGVVECYPVSETVPRSVVATHKQLPLGLSGVQSPPIHMGFFGGARELTEDSIYAAVRAGRTSQ